MSELAVAAPIPLVWPGDPLGRIGVYTLQAMFRRNLPGWHCLNPACRAFNGAAKEWLKVCRCCGQPGGQEP